MISLKRAYNIATDFFIRNGYVGVYEIRELKDKWVSMGKSEETIYGASQVCIPKNGDEPYLIDISHEPELTQYNKAKRVDIPLIL